MNTNDLPENENGSTRPDEVRVGPRFAFGSWILMAIAYGLIVFFVLYGGIWSTESEIESLKLEAAAIKSDLKNLKVAYEVSKPEELRWSEPVDYDSGKQFDGTGKRFHWIIAQGKADFHGFVVATVEIDLTANKNQWGILRGFRSDSPENWSVKNMITACAIDERASTNLAAASFMIPVAKGDSWAVSFTGGGGGSNNPLEDKTRMETLFNPGIRVRTIATELAGNIGPSPGDSP